MGTQEQYAERMAQLGIKLAEPQALEKRGLYNALTEERAAALVEAIRLYPNFKTACASCFVSDKTVMSWLRRGTMSDSSPLLAMFAANFLKADADHAKDCYDSFKAMAAEGNGVASQILKYMTGRWRASEQDDLMAQVDVGKKKTDNLEALLREPTPRLLHMLRVTGWIRHAAWGTDSWGKVINTTGIEAPSEG